MQPLPLCFVIMPFSKTTSAHTSAHWKSHYEDVLKPLIEEDGTLVAERSKPVRANVLHEIIRNLVLAPVVVADLSDHNANVFWELGVRLSYRSGTVTIAEEGTRLPFDLGHKGTLFYNTKQHVKWEAFRREFKAALQDCLHHPDKCDSPVMEAVTERPGLFEMFRRDELIRRLDAVLMECEANYQTLEHIHRKAATNLESSSDKGSMSTRIPTYQATALFASEQYVDADPDVYIHAIQLVQDLQGFNMILHLWAIHASAVSRWIIESVPAHQEDIRQYQDEVRAIRKDILARR